MKLNDPKDMTQNELKDWIGWAMSEIEEYRDFVKELKRYLEKPKKGKV